MFTNNFELLDDGRAVAQNLHDEGADIVLPVAGLVGLEEGMAGGRRFIGLAAMIFGRWPQHLSLASPTRCSKNLPCCKHRYCRSF